jgi:hypothetical protein
MDDVVIATFLEAVCPRSGGMAGSGAVLPVAVSGVRTEPAIACVSPTTKARRCTSAPLCD